MPQGLIGGKNCIGVSNPSMVQILDPSCKATIDTLLGGANHFKIILNYLSGFAIHGDLLTVVSFHLGVGRAQLVALVFQVLDRLDVAGQSKYELRAS